MELWKLLDIRPGLTAVIGSGGKTSLLRAIFGSFQNAEIFSYSCTF